MSRVIYNPYSSSLQVLPSVEWARNVVKQITQPLYFYNGGVIDSFPVATMNELEPATYYYYDRPLTRLNIGRVVDSNLRSVIVIKAISNLFSCPALDLDLRTLTPGLFYRIDVLRSVATVSSVYSNTLAPTSNS